MLVQARARDNKKLDVRVLWEGGILSTAHDKHYIADSFPAGRHIFSDLHVDDVCNVACIAGNMLEKVCNTQASPRLPAGVAELRCRT